MTTIKIMFLFGFFLVPGTGVLVKGDIESQTRQG